MKGDILVLAEHKNAVLENITCEPIGKGRSLADQWGTRLAVLAAGSELDGVVNNLKA